MNDNNYITILPKRGLKTSSYKMNMNKKDLKRLSKSQLIKLLIKQEKNEQANEFENSVVPQPKQEESLPGKSVNNYEDLIIEPQEQFRDRHPKPTRKPSLPPQPKDPFNFDDDIFQTENQSLEKFKIISVQSRQNKKFKSYMNEFKIKILKKLDDVDEIYHIFQELIKTVKGEESLAITICSDSSSKMKNYLMQFQQNSIRYKISS